MSNKFRHFVKSVKISFGHFWHFSGGTTFPAPVRKLWLIWGSQVTQMLRLTFPERNCCDKCLWPGEILGEELGEKLGEILDEISWGIFVLHWLCRTTHQNFSPNSSQFITPCLVTAPVTEISKFYLRELLGLGVPNKWETPKQSFGWTLSWGFSPLPTFNT